MVRGERARVRQRIRTVEERGIDRDHAGRQVPREASGWRGVRRDADHAGNDAGFGLIPCPGMIPGEMLKGNRMPQGDI